MSDNKIRASNGRFLCRLFLIICVFLISEAFGLENNNNNNNNDDIDINNNEKKTTKKVSASLDVSKEKSSENAWTQSLGEGEDLVVRAKLENAEQYKGRVYLKYVLGTSTGSSSRDEKFEKMRDDGQWPDLKANDGIYSIAVNVKNELGARNGDVVLFRAEAWLEDSSSQAPLRSPKENGDSSSKSETSLSQYPYYAAIVVDPNLKKETALPILHVLRANENDMKTDKGTVAKVFFDGRFYENVKIRRRGSGRDEVNVGVDLPPKDWPKHKFKFDFKGRQFKWNEKEPAVEEFNLNSHWQEPGEETFMRLHLANAIMSIAEVPAPQVFHLQMQVNGKYYGLFSFVEHIDETFLKRRNMWDEKNALYKAVSWKYSNLRAPNLSYSSCQWATPDWPRRWVDRDGYCPEIWRKSYPDNSKTVDDLWDFTMDIKRAKGFATSGNPSQQIYAEKILFRILDVPAVINEMAAQTILLNNDRCAKNYYVFFDSKTKRWSRLPWDLEDALPADSRYGVELCPSRDCSPKSTRYCVLSCEKFNSPLYCDSEHPQDIFISEREEQEAKSTFNELVNVILKTERTRRMYFARLRTLMNDILGSNFIESYVAKTLKNIRNDAKRDAKKWNIPGSIDQGVLQLLTQSVKLRREQLFETYSDMIPKTIPEQTILENVSVKFVSAKSGGGWIQTHNVFKSAVDISGYSISCADKKVYTFLAGTVLDSNQSIYIVADESKFIEEKQAGATEAYFFVQHGGDKFLKRLSENECSQSDLVRIVPRSVPKELKTTSPLSTDEQSCSEPEFGSWGEWGECCRDDKCNVYCDEPNAARSRTRELNFNKFVDALLDKDFGNAKKLCYPSLLANREIDKQCGSKKCGDYQEPYTCAPALEFVKNSPRLVLFGVGTTENWDSGYSWGIKEKQSLKKGLDGREDTGGSVKVALYGEGGFALGKKFFNSETFLSTFEKVNVMNVFVGRERYPQPIPSKNLQLSIEIYMWREGGVFSNSDSSIIFFSDARFNSNADEEKNKGWDSGCFEKTTANFKNDFRNRNGESFADFLSNKKKDLLSADTITVKVSVRNVSKKSPLVFYIGSISFN